MNDTRLSPAAVRLIDQTCDRFEAAWKAGGRPDPGVFLGDTDGDERAALLRELLLLDWEYRRRAGEAPRADDYAARFPADAAVVAAVGREAAANSFGRRASTSGLGRGETLAADPDPDDPPAGGGVGDIRSRYDLVHEVGRGGIGVVFRGRDRHLGRDLAVKVLRDAYRDRPDARRRFVAEGRVGSRLQHPGIVPVYELGRSADRGPFITMKLVEGDTLAALLAARPAPGHDLPRFLGVFVQVCQAVAYAHDRGVVHRDLKPHNVMVGSFGEVQVMDWGFAKTVVSGQWSVDSEIQEELPPSSTHHSPLTTHHSTQDGAVMGTPAYMPPEQARGDSALIDPRADVFALGAILCEVLTGRPPYTGETADEVCAKAVAGRLDAAFARLDGCGADPALAALAGRCLAADRAARPADARAVARDVTAYLDSAQERVRRAEVDRAAAEARAAGERRARRLTLALAAALLVGAGAAGWQAVAATRAERAAVAAADREAAAKRDALAAAAREAAAKQVAENAAAAESAAKQKAQAKGAETEAVLDFVRRRILAAARPKGVEGGLGTDVTLRAALAAAVPHVESGFKDQPLTEARLRRTLADSFDYLGDARAAAPQYESARAIYERLLPPDDPATLNVTDRLAISLRMQDRTGEAVALWEHLLPRCQARLGAADPQTLDVMHNLAVGYINLRRYDRAEEMLKDLVAVKQRKFGPGHRSTLLSTTALANVYLWQERFDEAHELRLRTWELQKANLGEADSDTLVTAFNIGAHYRRVGDFAAALRYDKETARLRTETFTRGHPETIQSLCAVAEDLVGAGRPREAVPYLDECLALGKGQYVHPSFARVADVRLRVFQKAGDAAGCRETAERWEGQGRTDGLSLFVAAKCRAVTATLLQRAGAPAGEVDAEAGRAVKWLAKAKAAGYKDVARTKHDPDFAALHARTDFRQVVAE
jgi:hypothetical protein